MLENKLIDGEAKGARALNNTCLPTLESGEVVGAKAEKCEDFLKEIIKTDEGAKRIAEMAVGIDTGIDRLTKNMRFDEKRSIDSAKGDVHGRTDTSHRRDLSSSVFDTAI